MNLQFYVEKLKASKTYKEFMEKNPDAFPCSGFFVIDKQGMDEQQHFDFYIPAKKDSSPSSTNSRPCSVIDNKNLSFTKSLAPTTRPEEKGKMVSFKLENNCELEALEFIDEKPLKKLDLSIDFDFKEIEKMIEARKEKEKIKSEIQKYLFSLQNSETGHILVGTIFISMLGMLHVKVDLDKKEVVELEKKSFFDIMKIKKGKKKE
jgi:hypothetical protein